MKRLFILLIVCALILAGCNGQKEQPITESQSTELVETEDVEIAELESMDENRSTEAEESKEEPESITEPEKPQQDAEQSKSKENTPSQEKKTEPETPASTETPTPAPTAPEQPKEQHTEASAEPEVIAYDPYEVVSIATAKTKAYGKVSIPENLDNMLANGQITKAEYNEYYPYDGAGYYSVFMETNLSEARTTSGKRLESEEEIAQYIADMLAIENGPYFLIEYAGVYTTGGNDFYEFRCYRA